MLHIEIPGTRAWLAADRHDALPVAYQLTRNVTIRFLERS
jgi:hypothetical protein